MKLPQTSTPLLAGALLGLMALAFVYQGFTASSPPSFFGAVILLGGAVFAVGMAMRKRRA